MRFLTHLALAAMVGFVVGCAQERQSTPNAAAIFKVAQGHDVQEGDYHIDPPDEIVLKSPTVKEVDGVKHEVRPDGKISLNLLGDIKVAGKTPDQVSILLNDIARKYYNKPDIRVEVAAKSKFYMVFGTGVTTPGKKAFTGHDTIVRALAECGFSETAWPQQVRLSRPARDGHQNATAVVDFTKVYEYAEFSQNYLLEEGDIIHVPDSPLDKLNKDMVKLLGPLTGATQTVGSANVVRPGSSH